MDVRSRVNRAYPDLNDPIGLLICGAAAALESSRRDEYWKLLNARTWELLAVWRKARIEGVRILGCMVDSDFVEDNGGIWLREGFEDEPSEGFLQVCRTQQ